MLGGLIAGAMGGGASSVSALADQAIAEALQAKKNAYDKGILEWKVGKEEEAATVAADRQQGIIAMQLKARSEDQDKSNQFTAGENEKNRNAQLKAANISASRGDRVTATEQAQAQLLGLKNQYLQETDPTARKQLAEDIAFFEGRKPEKPDYVTLKTGFDGAEKRYIQTPQGLVEMPIPGVAGKDDDPGKTNPAKGGLYKTLFGAGEEGSNVGTATTAATTTPPQAPKLSTDGTDTAVRKRMYNEQINKSLLEIQKQIPLAKTDQEKLDLSRKYTELHGNLKK